MDGCETKKDPCRPAAYRLGDVIYRSQPWVYSVLQDTAPLACYRCLRTPFSSDRSVQLQNKPPLRRCAQCKFAHYCSQQCQKEDWTDRHQPECKILSKLARSSDQLSLDVLLILLKIIIRLKKEQIGDEIGACSPPSARTFNQLMSHEDELKGSPGVVMLYKAWKPYIAVLDKEGTVCQDLASFVGLYGRFHTNGFSIADYFAGNIGKGLYLAPSIIDHSCDPNAVQFFVGKTMVVKAIRDIPSLEEVSGTFSTKFSMKLKLSLNNFDIIWDGGEWIYPDCFPP
ncbi:hypothetical protein RvY_18369-2 [Ramazzottius varieornatus]|uniref:MYND-type domain-containing protein n=1 Tax=Ramazzottius varieornatus TaxID=947166 RepID=A0A1D1W748_RAMVA|nr:hypothetical protein RvY_18369-2 [Ramazzottius varieornatus]